MKACGKFPKWRLPRGSYSSEIRPTSLHRPTQPFEDRARLIVPAHHRKVVREPERAGQKCPSPARQAIDIGIVGRITADQTFVHQVALNSFDGADDARVVAGRNPTSGHHQH